MLRLCGLSMDGAGVLSVALFVLAAFIVVLMHEIGHAVTGRWLGKGTPTVYLAWLGGVCCNPTAILSRMGGVLMTAAGPFFNLLTFLITAVGLLCVAPNLEYGLWYIHCAVMGTIPSELMAQVPPMVAVFMLYLSWGSFWLMILNLLPIFPLDGGQIMGGLIQDSRIVHGVSMFFAVLLAIFFFALAGSMFWALLMLFFVFVNYQALCNSPT